MLVFQKVAPHVGAWIETPFRSDGVTREKVAPHVGAWIETEVFGSGVYTQFGRTSCRCVD